MTMSEEKDYDVVVDVLTKHRDQLWKMCERNMNSDYVGWNIMDDIRERQIADIDECIAIWQRNKTKVTSD